MSWVQYEVSSNASQNRLEKTMTRCQPHMPRGSKWRRFLWLTLPLEGSLSKLVSTASICSSYFLMG